MNIIHIAGHLGADPEIRFTSSGQKVTTLRVASRTRKSGNDDSTIWWRVTLWGEQFDKMVSYLKKGSAVMVVGELNKPEIFTDREGKSQISMSITASNVMFSPFGRSDRPQDNAQTPSGAEVKSSIASEEYAGFAVGQQEVGSSTSTDTDEIPF